MCARAKLSAQELTRLRMRTGFNDHQTWFMTRGGQTMKLFLYRMKVTELFTLEKVEIMIRTRSYLITIRAFALCRVIFDFQTPHIVNAEQIIDNYRTARPHSAQSFPELIALHTCALEGNVHLCTNLLNILKIWRRSHS